MKKNLLVEQLSEAISPKVIPTKAEGITSQPVGRYLAALRQNKYPGLTLGFIPMISWPIFPCPTGRWLPIRRVSSISFGGSKEMDSGSGVKPQESLYSIQSHSSQNKNAKESNHASTSLSNQRKVCHEIKLSFRGDAQASAFYGVSPLTLSPFLLILQKK